MQLFFALLAGALCLLLGAVPAGVIAYQWGHKDGTDKERERRAQADIRDRNEKRQRLADAEQRDPWVTEAPPRPGRGQLATRPALTVVSGPAAWDGFTLDPPGVIATPPPDDDTRHDIPAYSGGGGELHDEPFPPQVIPSFTPTGPQSVIA